MRFLLTLLFAAGIAAIGNSVAGNASLALEKNKQKHQALMLNLQGQSFPDAKEL